MPATENVPHQDVTESEEASGPQRRVGPFASTARVAPTALIDLSSFPAIDFCLGCTQPGRMECRVRPIVSACDSPYAPARPPKNHLLHAVKAATMLGMNFSQSSNEPHSMLAQRAFLR